jgi:hypothetical protein
VSSRGKFLAATTAARYAGTVEKVKPSIGAVRLVDLRPAHLERLRDELGAHLALGLSLRCGDPVICHGLRA